MFTTGAVLAADQLASRPEKTWSVTTQEGPRLPSSRGSHAGGMIDRHVIIAGGETWNAERTVKSYLSETRVLNQGRWIAGQPLPTALAESAFAADGTSLYLAGGLSGPSQPTHDVYRLELRKGLLAAQKLTPLSAPLVGAGGEILEGSFYVLSGYLNGRPTNRLSSLDLSKPDSAWNELAPLPGPGRAYSAFAACGDSLFSFGGLGGLETESNDTVHQRTLSDVYRFDPKANRWNLLGQLPVSGYAWSASAIDQSHLLLAGRADGEMHDDIWIVGVSPLSAQLVGHCVAPAVCAPLIRVAAHTWWLVGGEPDMQKHRTDRVTVISLR